MARAALPVLILGFGVLLATAAVKAGSSEPTKGAIPDAAIHEDGTIDRALAPDFISVWGSDRIVGYVRQNLVLGTDEIDVWPVYGEDLKTVVGHMVAGKGFIPLGVDERTVPDIPVEVSSD